VDGASALYAKGMHSSARLIASALILVPARCDQPADQQSDKTVPQSHPEPRVSDSGDGPTRMEELSGTTAAFVALGAPEPWAARSTGVGTTRDQGDAPSRKNQPFKNSTNVGNTSRAESFP
jgi:hypothetical protein